MSETLVDVLLRIAGSRIEMGGGDIRGKHCTGEEAFTYRVTAI